jgi:hypothetical protein
MSTKVLPLLAALLLAAPVPALAQAGGQVVCDVKVMRLVHTLKDKAEDMSPQELDTARRALYKAISECRPLRASHPSSRRGDSGEAAEQRRKIEDTVEQDRQSLRMQQHMLTRPELSEGERRLDDIRQKAQTDPYAARQMQQQYQIDHSLSTGSKLTEPSKQNDRGRDVRDSIRDKR